MLNHLKVLWKHLFKTVSATFQEWINVAQSVNKMYFAAYASLEKNQIDLEETQEQWVHISVLSRMLFGVDSLILSY